MKLPIAEDTVKYKQTDISFYFKVRNSRRMKTLKRRPNDKENPTAKLSFEKKSPISNDSEDKCITLNEKRQTILQELPFEIPKYTDSDKDLENVDSTICNQRTTPASPQAEFRNILSNSEPIASTSTTSTALCDDSEATIIISSGDEDFEPTPRKVKKRMKLSSDMSVKFSEKYENSEAEVTSPPKMFIGVYRPVQVATLSPGKPKPLILQKKDKFSSNLHAESHQESSDCSSTTNTAVGANIIEENTAIPKCSSTTNTAVGADIIEKNTAIPKETTTNIMASFTDESKIFLEQCSISPIRATSTPVKSSKFSPKRSQKSSSKKVLANGSQKTTSRAKLFAEDDTNEEEQWSPVALRLLKKIISYITSHNHLQTMLTPQEKNLLHQLCQLPKEEYLLFCIKLYVRIQKWYNIFKFSNSIQLNMTTQEVTHMYHYLSELGFVDTDYSSESCSSLLDHLLRPDIKDICNTFKLKLTSAKKADMIQKLVENCNRQSTLTCSKSTEHILKERIKDKMGFCAKLNSRLYNLFSKVHILYSFTTSDFQTTQDLYLFMLRIDTFEILMPKTHIDKDFPVFSSITEFSVFCDAYELKRSVIEAIDKKQTDHLYELCTLAYTELKTVLERVQEKVPSYLMRFTAGSKYTKALWTGSKHLTKHCPEEVQKWLQFLLNQTQFCQQMRGLWYDTLIMVQYYYLKQHSNAAETIITALSSKNLSEVFMYELNYRAEAIKRSKTNKITNLQCDRICFVQPAPLEEFATIEIDARAIHGNEPGRKRHYLQKTEDGRNIFGVENVALNHYLENGFTNGVHCEGSLLTTILFVLFWDIIYEVHVPGVFINEIQYIPLDLYSIEFYTNRRELIDQRLTDISTDWSLDKLKLFIQTIWEAHSFEKSLISSDLVNDSDTLFQIVLCVGRTKLAQILERIIKNFLAYRSGIPDLFLWNFNEKKCKFVEVKGEKDKLSTKQKLWLNFLNSVEADAEVCHVHTIGSKSRAKIPKKNKEVKNEED